MDKETAKEKIMEATIEEFNEKGIKFTMDDVSKRLGMSKKTVYTLFQDKEELFRETIDYGFDQVKLSEKKILEDQTMGILEKIKRIIVVLPDRYLNIDFRKIAQVREKYPKLYGRIQERIEHGWEPTIELLNQAMEQGLIRKISIPVVKSLIEGTIEHFLSKSVLTEHDISYEEALEEMIDILMNGLII